MSREIVFITGSPSPTSRSSFVASAVAEEAKRAGFAVRSYGIRDFDAADVFLGQSGGTTIKAFLEAVAGSAAIVLSTPVYKATYSGALKAIVDLVPADALVEKPALGIATSKLGGHGSGVGSAFVALFAFFRARPIDSLVVLDDELRVDAGKATLAPQARARVDEAARALVSACSQ
jgi:FMN reductase